MVDTVSTTTERRPWHARIFYGWWIVSAGVVINMMISGLLMQAYGAYVVLLRDDFGWSRTVLGAGFSVMRAEIGLLGPIEGWLIDRFGPRAVMRVGITLFGLGFIFFSQVRDLYTFFAAIVVMAVGTALAGFLPLTVCIVNWFDRRRSAALGILLTGFACGALIVPAVAWSLDTFGWRPTAFGSGLIVLAIGLPLTFIIRHRPEDYGYLPDGDPPRPARTPSADGSVQEFESPSGRDFTVREALHSPAFWFLSIGHGSALLIVAAVMVHLIAHLTDGGDFSLQQASAIVVFMTLIQIGGQLGGGFIGDRVDKRALVVACMMGHAVGLVFLAFATALWMVLAFAVLHGLGWGIRGPLMASMRADYFGRAAFGTIMGFSTLVSTVGMIGGPLVAGAFYDAQDTYKYGFTVLAGLAALGGLAFLLAKKPERPIGA